MKWSSVSVACPLCESDHSLPLWQNSAFQLRFCPVCGLHWASCSLASPVSPPYDMDYYERNYLGEANARQRGFFAGQLQRLSPHWAVRRVLDVGFGVGFFIEEALKQGWTVSGIESSESAFRQTQARTGSQASLYCGDFLTTRLNPGQFDLVCFWDVLAHVPDPRAFLLHARSLLSANGELLIKTPLRSGAYFKGLMFFPHWIRESLIHWPWQKFFFSPSGLTAVLRKAGFSSVEVMVIPEVAGQSVSWRERLRHPKGALLAGAQSIYNQLLNTGSMILRARLG